MRERAAADIEAAKAQAIADLRAEVAALAIGAAEVVVQHNLDASTQTQLVENYISQVGAELRASTQDRIDGYAEALFEVARRRGHPRRGRGRAVPLRPHPRGLRRAAQRARRSRHIPASRRQQIVEDLLGGKATGVTTALVSFVVGAGRARDLPAIID